LTAALLRRCGLAALLLSPAEAQAAGDAQHLHYVAYSTGLRVIDVVADFDLGQQAYSVTLSVHTIGLFGAVVHGATESSVHGRWTGPAPFPATYDSHGLWRGEQLHVAISYAGGQPTVATLLPADTGEREAVPVALWANTIDNLSAMAALLRDVATTGRCDGRRRVFDGRRLSEIAAVTAGTEVLPETDRSVFHGPALRCDFTGTLLAGFKYEDNRARAARPQHGAAWFAPLRPGGPPLPVRVRFATPFFGDAILYLAP